jgi:hypothetical protein
LWKEGDFGAAFGREHSTARMLEHALVLVIFAHECAPTGQLLTLLFLEQFIC